MENWRFRDSNQGPTYRCLAPKFEPRRQIFIMNKMNADIQPSIMETIWAQEQEKKAKEGQSEMVHTPCCVGFLPL